MKLFPLKQRSISPLLFKDTMKALLDGIISIAVVVSAWFSIFQYSKSKICRVNCYPPASNF